MAELTTREVIELGRTKPDNTPNHAQDQVADAMAKARELRNAGKRKMMEEADKQNGLRESIDASVANFNEKMGIKEETIEETETTVEATSDVTDSAPIEDLDENELTTKITRTINGKKVTKTLGEWLGAAEKVEQADDYLSQAAQHLQRTQAPKVEEPKVEVDETELDALADAISSGSSVETKEALRKWTEKVASGASQKAQTQLSDAERQSRINSICAKIGAENDWCKDSYMLAAVRAKDDELLKSNKFISSPDPFVNLDARVREAYRQTKDYFEGLKKDTEAERKKQELIEKKRKLLNVGGANTKVQERTQQDGPKTFATAEEYNRHVAQQMNNKRRRVMVQ